MTEPKEAPALTRLGHYLKTLRRARGLTQHELLVRLGNVGLSQSRVSRLEGGAYHPRAGHLEAILRALEASEHDATAVRRLSVQAVRPEGWAWVGGHGWEG